MAASKVCLIGGICSKSASNENAVAVIQSHRPENKAARQDLRLRMSPAGAILAAELVTRFSTRSELGPSLWFAFDEPEAALGNREAEGKSTG